MPIVVTLIASLLFAMMVGIAGAHLTDKLSTWAGPARARQCDRNKVCAFDGRIVATSETNLNCLNKTPNFLLTVPRHSDSF